MLENEKSNDFVDDYIQNIFQDLDLPEPAKEKEPQRDHDWSYEENLNKE